MGDVVLHVHGDLRELVPAASMSVAAPTPRSVKDAVESTGIPHTEVGLVVVDGRSVDWAEQLTGGEVVQAWPVTPAPAQPTSRVRPPRPPEPVRFVADVHLGTLARRLRLLGLDTWWSNDADDPLLASLSVEQGRVLLTRDRHLLMRRIVVHGALVRHDDPPRQLDQVVARYGLAGHLAPRSRCVRCNGRLERVPVEAVADRLEPGTRAAGHDSFGRCRDCAQLYWPGAHDDGLTAVVEQVEVPPRIED